MSVRFPSSIAIGAFLVGWLAVSPALAQPPPSKDAILQVRRIWDRAPHNAFTDLVRFRDRWYCAFREAKSHAGGMAGQGKLRVITSDDAESWESAGLFESPLGDMRDGKLSF